MKTPFSLDLSTLDLDLSFPKQKSKGVKTNGLSDTQRILRFPCR